MKIKLEVQEIYSTKFRNFHLEYHASATFDKGGYYERTIKGIGSAPGTALADFHTKYLEFMQQRQLKGIKG
jgi:hypothetical protein